MSVYRYITPCNFYIIAWCTYYLQGTLYANGSIISKLSLLYIIFCGVYHSFIIARANNNQIFFSGFNLLLLLVSIYGGLNVLLQPIIVGNEGYVVTTSYFLKTMLASLLPVYSCYYFSKKGDLSINKVRFIAVILTAVSILSFYGYHIQRTAMMGIDEDDDVTNNYAYRFVALMPGLFLFEKRRLVQAALLGIYSFYILQGFKRGAILTGGVCIIYYMYLALNNARNRKDFLIQVILLVMFAVFCVVVINDLADNSFGFQRKYSQIIEGDSSSRDIIYSSLLRTFIDKSSLWQLLFGWGAHQTVSIAGNYAHQDWLEFLIDCGVLGIIVLALFFVKCIIGIKRSHSLYKNVLYMSMLIIFTKTLFSMSISDITLQLGLWIGWAISESVDEFGFDYSTK